MQDIDRVGSRMCCAVGSRVEVATTESPQLSQFRAHAGCWSVMLMCLLYSRGTAAGCMRMCVVCRLPAWIATTAAGLAAMCNAGPARHTARVLVQQNSL